MNRLIVWRLCAAKYAGAAFSGEGARLYGGRWSPPGCALAYCAESRALAVIEVLVNTDEPDRLSSLDWRLIPAEVPPTAVEVPKRYPDEWRQYPHPRSTQEFGARWAHECRTPALRVPSAIVPGEFNYLLNPKHPEFAQIKIGPPVTFAFDSRLMS